MKSGILFACILQASVVCAQTVDHPIITEIYTDPAGLNDGPVGRDPANEHQGFIEIFLPAAGDLSASLNKDNLRLTFYEVEGDETSSGVELVNYRFDLPAFDLDPNNGMTAGTIPRPTGGVVILGWVDYVGNPPVALAGTASTRTGLVLGGITSPPSGVTFIAMNGHHFSGTTNFPILSAESLIDLPGEASSGVIQNGSSAYLLVNRDSVGYVELFDDKDPFCSPTCAGPVLPSDFSGLRTSALLDGFASNDHSRFVLEEQPYVTPTGRDIDLETVLPSGGAFSLLIPQIPETVNTGLDPGIANGYARRFVDVAKTTENASTFDDDPVQDALNAYRHIRNSGPFFPTPGEVTFTASPPELSVASSLVQNTDVLSQTTAQVPILAANVGGQFGIDISVTPGPSSAPATATFAPGIPASNVSGQTVALPRVAAVGQANAIDGASATASVTISGINTTAGDPVVVSPVHFASVTATVLNPTTGLSALGQPLQATVFVAIQAVPAQAGVLNEFLDTDLATFIQANLGAAAQETSGITTTLLNPTTNLNDGFLVNNLIKDFPDPCIFPGPCFFLNFPAPPVAGKLDLVQTLLQSAEVQSGQLSYEEAVAFDQSGLFAIRMNVPDTITFGGTFSPSEPVSFVGPTGDVGNPTSGLTNATTTRTFEIALIDTQVRDNGTISTGATDDFGLMIEVQDTEPGSPVVDGEFVFLSFTGGLQGADIDTLNVPNGNNVATIIYLDLDNLHDVLGIRSIEQVIIVDGNGSGEVDLIEAYSLNAIPGACMASSVPAPAMVEGPLGGQVVDSNNRTLRFTAGTPGRSQAIRVTFVDLPIPFDAWNGTEMWVGPPQQVSELGGAADSTPPTFTAGRLQCDLNAASFQNWSALGTITVFHEGIVPGGRYSVDVLDISCSPLLPADFSDAVLMDTGPWGDIVGQITMGGNWTAPNASVDIVTDIVALLQKFASLPTAPAKGRCDIEPAALDFTINISDVTFALQAFQGRSYPFTPPPGPACP